MLSLTKMLNSSAIITEMKASTSEAIFDELLALLHFSADQQRKIKKELIAREKQSSTSIGNGVAVPHVRTKQVEGTFHIVIGRSTKGIPFGDTEGKLTHIFFLIIGPQTATQMFLKLLGQISFLMKEKSLRQQILSAQSNLGIFQALVDAEENLKLSSVPRDETNKELMVIVLYREEFIEEIYQILVGYNITKATILDGIGIGKAISMGIPLFNTFRDIMQEDQPANKTILAIVDKSYIDPIIQRISALCGDLRAKETGILFTVPVNRVEGLAKSTEKEPSK
ncbi:PTS sugar transporter subunit IIA [candidate division KSB1 bacterium]|nr:PTS sugar transporter subunit IIA [candidate division KSB1 bacterium]